MRDITRGVLALAAVLTAAPLAGAQTPTEPAAPVEAVLGYPYGEHFPETFSGVGFTMMKQHFLDYLATKQMAFTANSSNTVFAVSTPDAPFTSVLFFFNSNAGEILTEIELRFADEERAKAYAASEYPLPPKLYQGHEPEFLASDPGLSYRAKAWQFRNKVYFVATMANTRWSNQ